MLVSMLANTARIPGMRFEIKSIGLTSQVIVGICLPVELPDVLEAVQWVTLVTPISACENPTLVCKLKVHYSKLYDVLEALERADDVCPVGPGPSR